MQIRIVAAASNETLPSLVTFESTAGTARARWVSKEHQPRIDKSYDVELDVDGTVSEKTNARKTGESSPGIAGNDEETVLRARVESVDVDGMAYLRLATDCLVMIETEGEFSAGDFIEIRLPPKSVSVTVTGVSID
jgi:hypothetical protein